MVFRLIIKMYWTRDSIFLPFFIMFPPFPHFDANGGGRVWVGQLLVAGSQFGDDIWIFE